jgi:hypothetical protein
MGHRYFVSYAFFGPSHKTAAGFGNIEVTIDEPLSEIAQIAAIEEDINEEKDVNECLILFWRRFEEPAKGE